MKTNLNMKKSVWIGIVVGFIVLGIITSGFLLIQKSKPEQDYVKGEIIVGFYDNISEKEATNLIHSYNLERSQISPEFSKTFFLKLNYKPKLSAEEGWEIRKDIARQVEEKDKEFHGENFIVSSSEPYSNQIIVTFNEKAIEETAKELINNFEGLEIVEIVHSPKFMSVSVPEGEENKWIKILEKEEIVEYAELNFITQLD